MKMSEFRKGLRKALTYLLTVAIVLGSINLSSLTARADDEAEEVVLEQEQETFETAEAEAARIAEAEATRIAEEEAAAEEPVVAEPAVEEPEAEEPVAEEPAVEEPVEAADGEEAAIPETEEVEASATEYVVTVNYVEKDNADNVILSYEAKVPYDESITINAKELPDDKKLPDGWKLADEDASVTVDNVTDNDQTVTFECEEEAGAVATPADGEVFGKANTKAMNAPQGYAVPLANGEGAEQTAKVRIVINGKINGELEEVASKLTAKYFDIKVSTLDAYDPKGNNKNEAALNAIVREILSIIQREEPQYLGKYADLLNSCHSKKWELTGNKQELVYTLSGEIDNGSINGNGNGGNELIKTIPVKFVDGNGNNIPLGTGDTDTLITVMQGDDITKITVSRDNNDTIIIYNNGASTTVKVPDGYELAGGNFYEIDGDQIKISCISKTYEVTVNYVDADAKKSIDTDTAAETLNVTHGGSIKVTAKVPQGYELQSVNVIPVIPGTANYTISGDKSTVEFTNVIGSLKVEFLCVTRQLKVDGLGTVTYNGKEQKLKPAVTDGEEPLEEGKDYKLEWNGKDFINATDKEENDLIVTVTGINDYQYSEEKSVTYRIEPKALVVTSPDVSQTYDGVVLTGDPEAVEKTGLVEGEEIAIVMTGKQTMAGESDNSFEVYFNDSEGYDSSIMGDATALKSNYVLEKRFGRLTVNKASYDYKIEIAGDQESVDYDGKDHTIGYKVKVNGNEYQTVNGVTTIDDTDIKISENDEHKDKLTITHKDADTYELPLNEDMFTISSQNYDKIYVEYSAGHLNIAKKGVTVTVEGKKSVESYTGESHDLSGYTAYVKIDDDKKEITNDSGSVVQVSLKEGKDTTVTGTDAGTYTKSFEDLFVVNPDKNHTVTYAKYGSNILEITKAKLTVTTESASKVYDGTPLTAEAHVTGLQKGEKVKVETSELTDAKEILNGYTIIWKEDVNDPEVTASQGNYFIQNEELGILVVTPKSITGKDGDKDNGVITIAPDDVRYNGEEQKKEPVVTDGGEPLEEGKDYTLSYSENTKDAGTVTVTVKGTGNYGGEKPVEYQITRAPLTITTGSASKTYDGTPLTNTQVTVEGMVNDETVIARTTGRQTAVGSSTNTYVITWDDENSDETSGATAKESNYEVIDENLGTLTVAAAPAGNDAEDNPTDDPATSPTASPAPTTNVTNATNATTDTASDTTIGAGLTDDLTLAPAALAPVAEASALAPTAEALAIAPTVDGTVVDDAADDTVTIEDEETPLAAALTEGSNDEDGTAMVTIEDEETPLAAGVEEIVSSGTYWMIALILLIAAALGLYCFYYRKKQQQRA